MLFSKARGYVSIQTNQQQNPISFSGNFTKYGGGLAIYKKNWTILVIKHSNFQIARHGDRKPEHKHEGYPKDPYKDQHFDGKLTEVISIILHNSIFLIIFVFEIIKFIINGIIQSGKKRELDLGKFLRTRYNDFLGPNYIPGSIDARSTDVNRTKESLGLILKGLMPKAEVPTKFDDKLRDTLLLPQMCPG